MEEKTVEELEFECLNKLSADIKSSLTNNKIKEAELSLCALDNFINFCYVYKLIFNK